MAASAVGYGGPICPAGIAPWHQRAGGGRSFSRPVGELDGTWVNVDTQGEQYVIQGQRVTRTNAAGTKEFTIQWDQNKMRWQWGTHGRLSLQRLGDDAIAWVPEPSHAPNHAKVWRWQRHGPVPPPTARGPGGASYAVPRPHSVGARVVQPCTSRSRAGSSHSIRRSTRTEEAYRSRHESRSRNWSQGRRRSDSRRRSRSRHRSQRQNYYHNHQGSSGNYRSHRGSRYGSRNEAHSSSRLPCGLTGREVYSLLFRDITPEDYDLLLRLDESVKKPAAGREVIDRLPDAFADEFMGQQCSICIEMFEVQDRVVALSCGHHFHRGCLERLAESSTRCPLCSAEIGD